MGWAGLNIMAQASLRWWERQATKNMAGRSLEKGLEEREGRKKRRRERKAVPGLYDEGGIVASLQSSSLSK